MFALKLYRGRSLRGKFFRAVLGGVVVPMVVVGIWLYQTAGRSGEAILRARLDEALERLVARAESIPAVSDSIARASRVDPGGMLIAVLDRRTDALIGNSPIEPALLRQDAFQVDGETWLARRRSLDAPAITIVAVSPLTAYTMSFERAARKDSLAILMVAAAALVLSTVLTRRMARGMEELALATDAVAAGDLDRRVSEERKDEVGRVGRAFNAMTESLRATLRQLSQREALVAVGEFAASLAHEIRNPLTSIRIDLQRVDEKLPPDDPLRAQLGRALREVHRLDQTVSGALRIARSGTIASDLVDLRVPLQRAVEVAGSEFEMSGGSLSEIDFGSEPLPTRGDESALEQLFLNLLLNAAQAIRPGDKAGVNVSTDAAGVLVEIWDGGAGMTSEQIDKVFDPFFSTKKDGTGLGLSVARQIVVAHRGTIAIDSEVDAGTTVSIRLPLIVPLTPIPRWQW